MFIEITECRFLNRKTLINTRHIQKIVPFETDSVMCRVFLVNEGDAIETRMTYEEVKELIEKAK